MKGQKFSISNILTPSPPPPSLAERQSIVISDDTNGDHDIQALPTPPRSPELHATKDQTKSYTQKHGPVSADTALKRKRDPIGQILDSLCNDTSKKTHMDQSAFSPIITSSCASQLSPLDALAQCDRRCFPMSPEAVCSSYQLTSLCNEGISKTQASIEQLQYIQAQKLRQQQIQQQQQQQQHASLHAGLHHPYMTQSNIARNTPHAQLLRSQQEQMLALEHYKINALASRNCLPIPYTNTPNTTPAYWMTWLKSPMNSPTSFPVKENRAPPPPRYQCDACKKSYSTFGGLSKHKQFHCVSHVKKDFNCKYCDKSYGSLGALKMHIRTHTLPCKCKLCGKAFSRPWLLQGHVRTHTGEKPFKCAHCGRAFADRSNLRAHLQTHSDIKKYGCKNCTKTFSRMSLLLKHEEGSCLGLRR